MGNHRVQEENRLDGYENDIEYQEEMDAVLQGLRDLIPFAIHYNECNTDDDQGDEIPAVIDEKQLCHLEEVNIDASEFFCCFKKDRFGRPLEVSLVTSPETAQERITVDEPREKRCREN